MDDLITWLLVPVVPSLTWATTRLYYLRQERQFRAALKRALGTETTR